MAERLYRRHGPSRLCRRGPDPQQHHADSRFLIRNFARARWLSLAPSARNRHADRAARNPAGISGHAQRAATGIPPGNPNPEIPPPVREPGAPPRPDELPGKMPDEMPPRGPDGPRTPNPATDTDTGARPSTKRRGQHGTFHFESAA